MQVMKLTVDGNRDKYTLYISDPYEMGMAVETALKNGYTDITIEKADIKTLAECNLINGTEFEIGE